MGDWQPVESMPAHTWCRTKRDGENGENVSCWIDAGDGGREYWDRQGYSTVINPGTFAAPTHWLPFIDRRTGKRERRARSFAYEPGKDKNNWAPECLGPLSPFNTSPTMPDPRKKDL